MAGTAGVRRAGKPALAGYCEALHREDDFRPATHRNYLSDLRQFAAWCEQTWREADEDAAFTPTLTADAHRRPRAAADAPSFTGHDQPAPGQPEAVLRLVPRTAVGRRQP